MTRQFLDLCKKRCSVRSYENRAIHPDDLNYLLEAARLAPSAVNFQPWQFIVIQQEENRISLQESYPRDWFKTAPLYIVVCGDHQQSWKRKADNKDHCDIDIAIAVEHICLAAAEIGLGTCWVCNFEPDIVRQCLQLPEHIEPIAILPVGYPNSETLCLETPKKRKNIQEIVKWEKY